MALNQVELQLDATRKPHEAAKHECIMAQAVRMLQLMLTELNGSCVDMSLKATGNQNSSYMKGCAHAWHVL